LALTLLQKEYQEPPALKLSTTSLKLIHDPSRASHWLAASVTWRKSPADLALAATSASPANGFSPSAATASLSTWSALHSELIRSRFGPHMIIWGP
ncbi:MAG: hypothetical protein WC943_13040, partial [Elusimicrobiota bacterium]